MILPAPSRARAATRFPGLLLLALLLLLAPATARAHAGTEVIVDTDMAADDARALALLLASPHLRVLAVVTSDGASPPDLGATNVCRMLRFLKQDAVVVGAGRQLAAPVPPFRTNATALNWEQLGEPLIPTGKLHDAVNVIRLALRSSRSGVLYICLGPLTNLADALEARPELAGRITTVLWYGAPPGEPETSWNAMRDQAALRKITAAKLRVEVFRWPEGAAPVLDESLLEELANLNSPAADLILRLHGKGRGADLLRARHLKMWDDVVALRLLSPSLGKLQPIAGHPGWRQFSSLNPERVRAALPAALRVLPSRDTVVLDEFPTQPELLRADMRGLAPTLIERHGLEEWKTAVLTSELHRHLGTYSIVGAKMGIRAREHFNVALDELQVESHAGLNPPLSCVNDGLQVATGASLGRGTISVRTNAPACEAVFILGERRLRLRLKPGFSNKIATDMAELVRRHGGTTPAYFEDVRTVSLAHWLDFDRTTMFEEITEHPEKLVAP